MDTLHKAIFDFLKENGYSVIYVDATNPFFFIDIEISGYELRLKYEFPIGFPYTFPKVYILEEFYKKIKYIPHVSPSGYICTFDSNVSAPNPYKANEVVLESIQRAIRIIDDGINKRNTNDFIEEFDSYWMFEEKIQVECFSLFTPGDELRLLYYYKDTETLTFYITDKPEKIQAWLLYKIGKAIKVGDFKRCFYFPIDFIGTPPYPSNNKEVCTMIADSFPFSKEYYSFMKKTKEEKLILFSHKVEGIRNTFGWMHLPFKTRKMKGFRVGIIEPRLLMLGLERKTEIHRFTVESVEQKRLFYRGGDGMPIPNVKVSIVGCGSIGSFLIESLSRLGINDFVLIDKETITSENIARHTCGASEIGSYKTEAIKKKLMTHYPYMKCECFPEDIMKSMSDRIEMFNERDVNFIVIGDLPTEIYFIDLMTSEKVGKPLIIIWVEPFILGGHCIILQKPQDIIGKLYNNDFIFRYRVLEDSMSYSKKESGCQSTFIPYSAFEIQQFINSFLDFFNDNFIKEKKEGNYLFSWCGKINWARKNGFDISSVWLTKNDRDILFKRLDE